VNNKDNAPNNLGDSKRLNVVVDHVIDGIITITEKGLIDSFSQAATNDKLANGEELLSQADLGLFRGNKSERNKVCI
jgi:hypothetical protein